MNTQHVLILSLILVVAISTILFFIRLYLKRKKRPISKHHYKNYLDYQPNTHISNVYQRRDSDFSSITDYSHFQHSGLDNPTPKVDDMFDSFKYSSTPDGPLFGGGDFGGAGAGGSYSSDSGSQDSSSSWSDSN